jgi:origin recognition complex subunit 4
MGSLFRCTYASLSKFAYQPLTAKQGLWNDKQFHSHLQDIYHRTKCVKDLFTSALRPLSVLHHSSYEITNGDSLSLLTIPVPKSFTSDALSCPDPASLPLPPLAFSATSTSSLLPLSLLLAATRLTALHDTCSDTHTHSAAGPPTLSFSAAYAEYVRLLTSAKANASASGAAATPGRIWGRNVARESWEKLIDWGVIIPVRGVRTGAASGQMYCVEITFEEVAAMVGGGGALGKWWRDG